MLIDEDDDLALPGVVFEPLTALAGGLLGGAVTAARLWRVGWLVVGRQLRRRTPPIPTRCLRSAVTH